ncbi:MAG: helix-turn-helix domain-containing protein [Labilithrix sp.]|nr:helix-turn-helix domain-containing protein [Labilithrix sp.]MBX3225272.1 helix-turn-helix domain-containing protein [Labilithrix sp.]
MSAQTVPASVSNWLKLDCTVSSVLRVRAWEKEERDSVGARAVAHPAVELTWVEQGTLHYTVGSRDIVVPEGHLVVIPRDVEHKTTFVSPMRGVALWLGAELVSQVAEAMGSEAIDLVFAAKCFATRSERVPALLRGLHDEVREGGDGYMLAAEAIAEAIVVQLLRGARRESPSQGARDPRVLAAIAQMRAAYAEPLNLEDLAKTARLSRFHFSRLFRDEVGETPYQYLVRLRIARALELLRGGHHSVTETALATGFQDFSRFSRTFLKHTGVRPGEMLRRARIA